MGKIFFSGIWKGNIFSPAKQNLILTNGLGISILHGNHVVNPKTHQILLLGLLFNTWYHIIDLLFKSSYTKHQSLIN